MTVLGRFAASTAVLMGLALLGVCAFTFPDRNWARRTKPLLRLSCHVLVITVLFEFLYALIAIWGVK